ncbi:ABC transporter substrate-binding protein [Undibacterium sp. CCC2.1]|nr:MULTISPECIES: ABC transporter substrate-binding protein [unclassified Undibacterium]MEB0139414.1 ABC transporter substrate-binding protein [Undibacterium sp. CCC2.1]MEB0174053.1 ABC transporter substrate-binding protein [Undibacterium sp. CCC1.1]MEB0177444.1 ABC transporter substrate-binding protein [Undibacterium sp. CCC3.4]MEB0216615.1 ABC transporter substrate-binding protein [Undibacterium sp. 5I2]
MLEQAANGTNAANTPKKGGHLRLGIDNASSTDRLDPASYVEMYGFVVGAQLFNTLIELNESGGLRPSLALSWEARKGAKEWIIKLRKGVEFHNGKPLTVQDVIYSLNHHRGANSASAAKVYLDSVLTLKATAIDELTIMLKQGNADLPYLLTDVHFGIGPDGSNFDKGIGTGAYVLENFQPGVRTLTRRNANYWDAERAHVDSVETIAYNDSTARIAALLSGRIHVVNRIEPRLFKRVSASNKINVHRSKDSEIFTFPGLSDRAPFNNQDVRLALKYALNRPQILKSVLANIGSIGNDQPIVPSNRYFAADLAATPYDPEKAAFHWKKSGYSGKLLLSVSDAGFSGAVDAAQLFQASAQKAGIPLELERVPADGYWENIWLKKSFVASNISTRSTADATLSLFFAAGAAWNETAWNNEGFESLLRAARAELNEAKRTQMYHDIQFLIAGQGSEIVPVRSDGLDASRANVGGFTVVPGLAMSGLKVAEKVWLES